MGLNDETDSEGPTNSVSSMSSASTTTPTDLPDIPDPLQSFASPFLELPIDIRHTIYGFALIANRAIDWPAESSSHHLAPSLLQTCKQIYHEAAPVLYKSNRFIFSHPSDCNVFRWIMDSVYASQIAKVVFKIRERDFRVWTAYHGSTDPIRSLSADLPHVQSLVVFLRQQGWSFVADPDEAFKLWDRNQRLRNLCMSLEERTNANVTVICSMEISEHHFEHLKSTQAAKLVVFGDFARTRRPVEMFSTFAILELFSPRSSCTEKNRVIGIN